MALGSFGLFDGVVLGVTDSIIIDFGGSSDFSLLDSAFLSSLSLPSSSSLISLTSSSAYL